MKILYALCLTLTSLANAAAADEWVDESNRHAMSVLDVFGQFEPERAAELGAEGYDEAVLDLKPKVFERRQRSMRKLIARLERKHTAASHPKLAQDLSILIDYGRRELRKAELERQHLLPYHDVSRIVFEGSRALLDAQVDAARLPAALLRLRRYAGLEPGFVPIKELAIARSREGFDANLLGPFRGEVEQDLQRSPTFIRGVEELFAGTLLDGWREPYETLAAQLEDYNAWVRSEILPRARSDHRLPAVLYAEALRDRGVEAPPETLIEEGLRAFTEIRNEMMTLAPLVAAEKRYDATSYREVIQRLKAVQVPGDRVLAHYRATLATLEAIIRRERLVTLPQRAAGIRAGSDAETARQPAPHLNPPRLIGNTGEYPEFVLPYLQRGRDGSWPVTDDTFEANAWTLTAHEARPGHELQFSAMIEGNTSIARAVFAWNSANIEGWGLYAEAIAKPYMPLDGQLISLQWRLLRAARMFLDPMVNLGLVEPEQAKRFLMEQTGVDDNRAQNEIQRYMYRMPGQATAYYYGYARLQELRARTELRLGARFDVRRFHDFVLAQGLLPPELLKNAVAREFVADDAVR